MILDFKENLRLGGGPRETNQMFYRMEQCSVLGFCLIHKSADGVVHKDYFDFFSSILSHDSLFVKDCLRDLVTDPSFPRSPSGQIVGRIFIRLNLRTQSCGNSQRGCPFQCSGTSLGSTTAKAW